jgi:thioredoxin reductase (NADPH)
MDLMQKVRDHVDHLGVSVEEVCSIESVDLVGKEKVVETDDAIYRGRALIVATGRKPVPLNLTACEEVHYCSICDGFPYAGKRVLVVGGGNSGFDESLYLMRIGISHLTLIEGADRFFAAKTAQEELLKNANVEARTNTRIVDVILQEQKLKAAIVESVTTGSTETIPADGIFAFLGQKPETDFLKGLVDLDNDGYVLARDDMSTNIPGVYSAGDLNRKQYRQLTTAMNDGTIAALACERYIGSGRN